MTQGLRRWSTVALVSAWCLALPVQAGTTSYTYDPLGRVLTATEPDGAVSEYAYDAAGNRTLKKITRPSNTAPVAVNDSTTTPAGVTLYFSPLTNDTDANSDGLTLTSVGTPSHGTVTIQPTNLYVKYIPTGGYAGSDGFTYAISDGRGGTANATVSVTVSTTNHAPVANADGISTPLNTAATFDPRTNDTDADGNSLTITAVGTPSHGTTSFTSTSVTYTPTTGYSGSDSFSYTISDSQPGGSASGAISVTITSGNQGPTANADYDYFFTPTGGAMTYDVYVLGNDTDPDSDTLTITSVSTPNNPSAPSQPTASIVSNHIHLTNLRVGTTTFTYTISDGHGHTATATVGITRELGEGCPSC